MKKIDFFVLTGPSGSGKSTLMQGLSERLVLPEVVLPLRVTTRPPRPTDNPQEVRTVSTSEFDRGVCDGSIRIPHQIRDKWNGLIIPDMEDSRSNCVYMQALPTAAGVEIRDTMSREFNVGVFRLKAPKSVVLDRLSRRGPKDDAPVDEAAQRAVVTPIGNDWEINAEHSAAVVLRIMIDVIMQCHGRPFDQWHEQLRDIADVSALVEPA